MNEELYNSISKGNRKGVAEIIQQAIDENGNVVELLFNQVI